MTPEGTCRFLDWDSELFGMRIARLLPARLDDDVVRQALDWCARESIRCLYFLADAGDGATVRLAEESGFRLVDVRVTFARDLAARPPAPEASETGSGSVREARDGDLTVLRPMAVSNHRNTRFHRDPTFTTAQADALYARWIERSCEGWADAVLVADGGDGPMGYVTCHLGPSAGVGSIGLVGVAERSRGDRVGSRLVDAALGWFTARGTREVTVVTQGNNLPAQRLYQRAGFLVRSMELWYHRSFP